MRTCGPAVVPSLPRSHRNNVPTLFVLCPSPPPPVHLPSPSPRPSYQLYWKSSRGTIRKGFAHCAKAARATIIPVMTENAEEMKFNPVMVRLGTGNERSGQPATTGSLCTLNAG